MRALPITLGLLMGGLLGFYLQGRQINRYRVNIDNIIPE